MRPGAVRRVARRREPVRRIQRWRNPRRPAIGRTGRLRIDEPKTPVLRFPSRLRLRENDIGDPETGDQGTWLFSNARLRRGRRTTRKRCNVVEEEDRPGKNGGGRTLPSRRGHAPRSGLGGRRRPRIGHGPIEVERHITARIGGTRGGERVRRPLRGEATGKHPRGEGGDMEMGRRTFASRSRYRCPCGGRSHGGQG